MMDIALWSTQRIPLLRIDVGLTQDAAQSADWDFILSRHNCNVSGLADSPHKLDVAALLANLGESCSLEPALDFAEGLGLKPPQPLPRPSEPWVAAWLAAIRSEVPALPLGW
jgi:hypothetical protein